MRLAAVFVVAVGVLAATAEAQVLSYSAMYACTDAVSSLTAHLLHVLVVPSRHKCRARRLWLRPPAPL